MAGKMATKKYLPQAGVMLFLVTTLVVGVYYAMKVETGRLTSRAAWSDPYSKKFSGLTAAGNFGNWSDWYPVKFGQSQGYRMINRWDKKRDGMQWMRGFSYLNVPNSVSTLPGTYDIDDGNGEKPIDYHFLWQCKTGYNDTTDPNCLDQTRYREIISQGSFGNDTTLEHWARGSNTQWEVYYDPNVIGVTNCNGQRVKTYVSDKTLNETTSKRPMIMKLPWYKNTYYVSTPVCALVYKTYNQSTYNTIDSRYESFNPPPSFEVGNWIVITINHDYEFDPVTNRYIIRAENIYLTDNAKASDRFTDRYCRNIRPADTLHCVLGGDGKKYGLSYTLDNKTYKTFAFEEYWMRATLKNQYGTPIKYGFGSFRWWTWSVGDPNEWDRIDNSGISKDPAADNQVYTLQKCTLDQWYNVLSCP